MTPRNIDQASTDIDDASATIEELQSEPDVDTVEKLNEIHEALADASDRLDEERDPGRAEVGRIPQRQRP